MGFWSNLFKNKSEQSPERISAAANVESDVDADTLLAEPIAALQNGQLEEAIRLAAPFLDSARADVCADAFRLGALAKSRLQDWPAAFNDWLALFELEPTSHNALQLASASVMCGEVARGEAWFAKYREIDEKTPSFPLVSATTNFISACNQSGHVQAALPYLEWMRDLYRHVGITDDTFLYLRGVPFLSTFLENSGPMIAAILPPAEFKAWFEQMIPELDEDGGAMVRNWLDQQAAPIDSPVS
ncbi:hypothetical protein [Andreprevotia chitinilytica]|uniref:hypothetical protein n=1 Tax=Andreprevotia chitinilytica TaxID=396808 RepID=UPI00054E2477|nr:hypothetical protein [Andreprevotia chitinilytica]